MNLNITNPIFHDEAKAIAHLEGSRWPDGATCPHCGSDHVTKMGGKTQAGMFLCNDCRDKFTVRTGSVMERSHVPLHKWLLATHIMAASKKGMSAAQMARMIGVTYKTAWFLCHRIREAMEGANAADSGPMGGKNEVVEADETYVGGKARNRATRKPAKKKAVVALVQRDGKARSFHVANVNAKDVRALVVTNIDRASTLMTDESPIYYRMGKEFASHYAVNHNAKEFVTYGGFKHSNTAENFFSIFKRGVIGTYHHMSEAHLGRYCAEFDLRYNTRELSDSDRASEIIKGGIGRRLTYRRTDTVAA
ncbi:IS1595 family transposase [Altererythrobacter sp. KTW20L]|uniref:IS1595 family transposase n=1 Tax=Altererythrobacter sp. KTW20L TaxID=2942210 RepID=UPI0020BEBA54|nr:IS1595 family transposase [Altererythrobacter sp. KTW20L]MCL6251850.1 IS1595 family transposase [Altererythrobacter sp. KTW20L]